MSIPAILENPQHCSQHASRCRPRDKKEMILIFTRHSNTINHAQNSNTIKGKIRLRHSKSLEYRIPILQIVLYQQANPKYQSRKFFICLSSTAFRSHAHGWCKVSESHTLSQIFASFLSLFQYLETLEKPKKLPKNGASRYRIKNGFQSDSHWQSFAITSQFKQLNLSMQRPN